MAQPTTRQGRFIERRRRYLRRRKSQYIQGWDWSFDIIKGYNVRGPRIFTLGTGPKQQLGLVKDALDGPFGAVSPSPLVAWDFVEVVGHASPPLPKILFVSGIPWPFNNNHPRAAIIGYHCRKVHARRHKPGRHDGAWRQEWLARAFVFRLGYWPDWDPNGRHPTFTDIQNGDSLQSWLNFPAPGATTPPP